MWTFCILSSAPPVIKVSFPLSSTVNAESLSKVTPAANGCPGLLEKLLHECPVRNGRRRRKERDTKGETKHPTLIYLSRSSYLIWIFDMESFRFPITVLIKDPSQDLFFVIEQTSKEKVVNYGRNISRKGLRTLIVTWKHDDQCQKQKLIYDQITNIYISC